MIMAFVLIFSSVEGDYATTIIEALSSGTVNPVSGANYQSGKKYQTNGKGWKTAWTGLGTGTLHVVDGHGRNYSGAKAFTPTGYTRSGNVVVNRGSATVQTKNLKFGDYTYIEFSANVIHQHPSICTWNAKWIKLNFSYSYSSNPANGSDAGKPYQISANASYDDIDAGQAVAITNVGLRATGVAAGNASTGKIYWRRFQYSSGSPWTQLFTDHTAKATDPNALTAAGYAFSSTSSKVVTSESIVFVSNRMERKFRKGQAV